MPNCQKQPPSGFESRFEVNLSECFEPVTYGNGNVIYRAVPKVPESFKGFFRLPKNATNFELVFYGSESFGIFRLSTDCEVTCEVTRFCNVWEIKQYLHLELGVRIFRSFGELFLQGLESTNLKNIDLLY